MLVQLELGETRLLGNFFAATLVSDWRFCVRLQIAARFPKRSRQMLLESRSDGRCHFHFPVGGPLILVVECKAGQRVWLSDLATLRVVDATKTRVSMRLTPRQPQYSCKIRERCLEADRVWPAFAAGKIENVWAAS